MIETTNTSEVTTINNEDFQVNVRTSCKDCINANICKYKDSFTDAKDNLLSLENLPEVAMIDIRCKYFMGRRQHITKKVDMRGREYNSDGSIKPSTFKRNKNN